MFETILGNEPIKAYLNKAMQEGRLPQTLLFSGPEGVGKKQFALSLAAELLGSANSPDLHILAPEGKSGLYAIDTLREMIDQDHAPPFEAPGKVFILEDVDRMQPASANALLKTLEEPASDTTFILLTNHHQEMLPTILSRCVILSFQPLAEAHIQTLLSAKGHPVHLAKLAHGSAGRAFEYAEHPELEQQRQLLFQILAQQPSYPELSLKLTQLEELVEEGKEEDPVRVNRRIESLFASILMWHRDQHVRNIGGTELFFPEEEKREPVSLIKVEKALDQARLAFQRNMKLSICFQKALAVF